jgi:hypothetical protein
MKVKVVDSTAQLKKWIFGQSSQEYEAYHVIWSQNLESRSYFCRSMCFLAIVSELGSERATDFHANSDLMVAHLSYIH